jgi:hypothetical protein
MADGTGISSDSLGYPKLPKLDGGKIIGVLRKSAGVIRSGLSGLIVSRQRTQSIPLGEGGVVGCRDA